MPFAILNRSQPGGPALGLSPKDYAAALQQQAEDVTGALNGAVAQNADAVQTLKKHTDILAQESNVGAAAFQEQQAKNIEAQRGLARESDEDQKRIQSELASLQAQGVDPNRYWQSRSTGEKIASALLMGLGALAAGPLGPHGTRGENVPLQIINQAIRDDLDAQRTNLTHAIEVTKMRGESSARGFEQQMALLRAERESGQTAYTLAEQHIARQAAMYQGNAQVQQQAAQLQAQVAGEKAKFVAGKNEELFRIWKATAGGGSQQVVRTVLKNGQVWEGPMAQYKELVSSGLAEDQSLAGLKTRSEIMKNVAGPNGGKPDAKTAEQLRAHDDAISNIDKMLELRKRHGGGAILSPNDEAQGRTLAARTQEQLTAALGKTNAQLLKRTSELVPDNPLETKLAGIVGADPVGTRLQTARQMLLEERQRLVANPGASTSDDGNPSGGKEEEE